MLKLGVRQISHLKCIYTNECSMANKQEELEAIVQQANSDLVAVRKHGGITPMMGVL